MKINFERIQYSPFGKKIFAKSPLTLIALTGINILLVIGLISCIRAGSFFLIDAALFAALLGYGVYQQYRIISEKSLQLRLLSDMTDDEHNELVSDYKKYKENNRITIGCLTKYGIILDEQICPWDIIKEIEFTPSFQAQKGKHRYIVSTTVKLHISYGKRRRVISEDICNYPADLSEDIQQFKTAIPEYTDRQIKINNRYYHTIF